MSPRIDEQELRRRAIEGVREEVVAFGSAAPSIEIGDDYCVTGVAGAPLYERLGFRDFGFVEMWELCR